MMCRPKCSKANNFYSAKLAKRGPTFVTKDILHEREDNARQRLFPKLSLRNCNDSMHQAM